MSGLATSIRGTSTVSVAEIGHMVESQEAERARIARELHDGVGQKLALLQMDLDRISRTLPSRERTQVGQLSDQIADIARELHEVSYELHPLRLEILGLAKSINALCTDSSRQSGVKIAFSCNVDLPHQIGASESLCLYRIAQEALTNVVKHSKATRASVQLAFLRDALELVVADTGQGFDQSGATNGLGLTSMRQRVQLLNGAIAVHTRKGAGTRISVRIPFRRQANTNCAVARRPRLVAAADTERSRARRRIPIAGRFGAKTPELVSACGIRDH
jgi:signal transduction histidine kinase